MELYVPAGIAVVLILWFIVSYNRFVRDHNRIQEAWSGIDVQLKRRNDLIPPIVDAVKAYTDYEASVLEDLTELRSRSRSADGVRERAETESMLSSRLSGILALAEDYPELKANENFLQLQRTLSEVEDQIQHARRYYNGTVRDYNIRCDAFPSLIVARCLGYEPAEFFEIKLATERESPELFDE